MAENKKSFVLYTDQKELIESLSDEQAGKLIKHIFRYVNDENPKDDDPLVKLAFIPIKQSLKRDLKKWEGQVEQRREAGKKSAEARRRKKDEEQRALTSVNEVERSSTDSVSASVSVSENVDIKNISLELMGFYDFTEMNNFAQLRDINQALSVLSSNKRLEYFIEQFHAYRDYKAKNQEKRHGFKSFIGTIEEKFEDGGWNSENWVAKLKSFKPDQRQRPKQTLEELGYKKFE